MTVRNDEGDNKDLRVPQWLGPLQLYILAPLHYAVVLRSEIAVMGNGSEARKPHSHRPQNKVVLFLNRHHRSCVI